MRFIQVIGSMSSSYGGPSVLAGELNAALRRIGVDGEVFTTDNAEPEQRLVGGGAIRFESPVPGSSVVTFARSRPFRLENSFSLLRALWREARNADALEMHGFYLLPHVYVYLAARRWRKPYGIEAHGAFEEYTRARNASRKKIFLRLIGRRMLQRASYVMFTSDSEAAAASELVAADRALVTTLGVSLPEPEVVPDIEARLEGTSWDRCVLYLGRLALKKQPDLLLEGWAKAPERETHRLVIAGPDGEFTRAELARRAEELGIADSVHLVGEVRGSGKAWLYQRCGVFVLPSRNENFGMAMAEALASGCYVVASREVAAFEHAEAAGAGTAISELTPSGIAAALSETLNSGAVTDETRRRAIAYAEQNLSWETTARDLRERLVAVTTKAAGG